MFHPRSANWFDLMVPQSALATALEVLADLNAVELEADNRMVRTPVDLVDLRADLDKYGELARRYRSYWPAPDRRTPFPAVPPAEVLAATLAHVQAWAAAAMDHINTLQSAMRQEADLRHLDALVTAAKEDFPLCLLSGARGGLFDVSIHILDDERAPDRLPVGVFTRLYKAETGVYLVAVGEKAAIARLGDDLSAAKARTIQVPELGDVAGHVTDELLAVIAARTEDLRLQQDQAKAAIARLSVLHEIAAARANVERLRWLADHVGVTANTMLFARVTGWTALDEAAMKRALDDAGLGYALSIGDPPAGLNPPMLLDNPRWVRPFEAFVRLMGMPARTEADPTVLVALIAPLLFGFMFGDVGQGVVLMVAGLVLRQKWPSAGILVPGGLFAVLFGFAFGSVFAREDVIGAFWLHPLAQPIPVLGVALAAGVVILLTGLVLSGAGAHWAGTDRRWWGAKAGVVIAYVGIVLSFANAWGLALTGAGALWFVIGSTILAPSKHGAALGLALGELVESLFQLAINTLSFVRVGAFAIAHAGLSSAVVVLADIAGGPIGFWLVMVVGNVFIIALEGLVAGIQTTRLMLFEFFIRFLHAEGRPLRALLTPAAWSSKHEGNTK